MRLLKDNVWPDIRELVRGHHPILAVCPYFTAERSLSFQAGDTLVVDASDQQITTGATSATAIKSAYVRGARVYSLSGLHAKVFVAGPNAIVGSANLTGNSETLREAALVTNNQKVRDELVDWIETLCREADCIDQQFLKRILAIKVIRAPRGARSRAKLSLLDAIRANDPILTDFVFRAWSEEPEISKKEVDKAIKLDARFRVIPGKWDYLQDEDGPRQRASVKMVKSRYLILFRAEGREGAKLKKFVEFEPVPYSFIDSVKVRGSLVSVFDIGKPCAFRLGGDQSIELCRLMNLGLEANPRLSREISEEPLWTFGAETLRKLVLEGDGLKLS